MVFVPIFLCYTTLSLMMPNDIKTMNPKALSAMRDDIDFEYFKQRLEKRLKELAEGQKPVRPLELDQSRVGRLSRMDAMQQQAMTQAASRLAATEEQRIRTALKRIASDEYGCCVNCLVVKVIFKKENVKYKYTKGVPIVPRNCWMLKSSVCQ